MKRRYAILYVLVVLLLVDRAVLWLLHRTGFANLRPLVVVEDRAQPPYYRLATDLRTTWVIERTGASQTVTTNHWGMRSPERPIAKPPGVQRIVLMGDSMTYGQGVADDEALGVQLERVLANPRVEIWNAGVPGYTMVDYVGQLTERVLPLQPDLILLQLARNDSAPPLHPGGPLWAATRYSGFARLAVIGQVLLLTDHQRYMAAFERYLATTRQAGIPVAVWTEGVPDDDERGLDTLATRYGATIFRMDVRPFDRLPMDVHFSAKGTREAAEALARAMHAVGLPADGTATR